MRRARDSEPSAPAHRGSSAAIGVVLLMVAAVAIALTAPEPGARSAAPGTALAASEPKAEAREPFKPIQCAAHGPTVRRQVKTKRKVVALTFDDGPSDTTHRVLRTLEHFGAHGTFFVVGRNIAGHEQILQRAVHADNAVGNHTFDHADVATAGSAAADQIRPTTKLIDEATGARPCVFRPPYGGRSEALDKLVERERMVEILWNVETADYKGIPPAEIRDAALAGIDRGNIILMHDGGGDEANTLAALPAILRAIKKRGYKAVTIPDMLGLEKKPTKKQRG